MTANAEQLHVETDVSAQRVGRVYAEALLDAAEKKGQAEEIANELDSLVNDIFRAHPEQEQFFLSAAVGRKAKSAAIQSVFGGRANELLVKFLLVLNDHDRLELVRVVRNAYRAELERRTNKLRVVVRSAVPLAEDQLQRIMNGVRQLTHREPVLDARVDPELLGGLTVRIGDQMFDGSVRTRIDTIGRQLIERSSHEIQTGRDRFGS